MCILCSRLAEDSDISRRSDTAVGKCPSAYSSAAMCLCASDVAFLLESSLEAARARSESARQMQWYTLQKSRKLLLLLQLQAPEDCRRPIRLVQPLLALLLPLLKRDLLV